jgi:hypothetical protein
MYDTVMQNDVVGLSICGWSNSGIRALGKVGKASQQDEWLRMQLGLQASRAYRRKSLSF